MNPYIHTHVSSSDSYSQRPWWLKFLFLFGLHW